MDPKRTQTNNTSAQAQADALARQYRASTLAAELIENAPATTTPNPAQSKRSAPSLNTDIQFRQNSDQDLTNAPFNEQFAAGAYADKIQQPVGLNKQRKPIPAKTYRYPEEAPDYFTQRARELRQSARNILAGKTLPSSLTAAKSMVGRAKASTINISAFSWGFFVWLFIQVPFALLGLLGIGVVAGIDALTSTEGGFFSWITGTLLSAATTVADTILKFVGIDFAQISIFIFTASYTIVLATGVVMILFLYLQYKIGLLNPIFGNGSSLKIGMLLLTIIGLATPVLNLLPLIVLWMAAVWLYPR